MPASTSRLYWWTHLIAYNLAIFAGPVGFMTYQSSGGRVGRAILIAGGYYVFLARPASSLLRRWACRRSPLWAGPDVRWHRRPRRQLRLPSRWWTVFCYPRLLFFVFGLGPIALLRNGNPFGTGLLANLFLVLASLASVMVLRFLQIAAWARVDGALPRMLLIRRFDEDVSSEVRWSLLPMLSTFGRAATLTDRSFKAEHQQDSDTWLGRMDFVSVQTNEDWLTAFREQLDLADVVIADITKISDNLVAELEILRDRTDVLVVLACQHRVLFIAGMQQEQIANPGHYYPVPDEWADPLMKRELLSHFDPPIPYGGGVSDIPTALELRRRLIRDSSVLPGTGTIRQDSPEG